MTPAGYGLRADPAHRQHRSAPRPGRPRRRLLILGLRPAPGLVPNPPRDRLGRRRPHRPEQPHPALRIPPPRTPQTRLDRPDDQRRTALATTPLDRPQPNAPPQHHPPHPRAPQPAPSTRTDRTVDASADDSEIGETSELTTDSTGATRIRRDQVSGRRQTKAVSSSRREISMYPHTEAVPAAGHGLPARPRRLAS